MKNKKNFKNPKSTNRKADSSPIFASSVGKSPNTIRKQGNDSLNEKINSESYKIRGKMLPITDHFEGRSWYHDRIPFDERFRKLMNLYSEYNDIVATRESKFPTRLIDELEKYEFDPPDDLIQMAISIKYRGSSTCKTLDEEREKIDIPHHIRNTCNWNGAYQKLYDDANVSYYIKLPSPQPVAHPDDMNAAVSNDHFDSHADDVMPNETDVPPPDCDVVSSEHSETYDQTTVAGDRGEDTEEMLGDEEEWLNEFPDVEGIDQEPSEQGLSVRQDRRGGVSDGEESEREESNFETSSNSNPPGSAGERSSSTLRPAAAGTSLTPAVAPRVPTIRKVLPRAYAATPHSASSSRQVDDRPTSSNTTREVASVSRGRGDGAVGERRPTGVAPTTLPAHSLSATGLQHMTMFTQVPTVDILRELTRSNLERLKMQLASAKAAGGHTNFETPQTPIHRGQPGNAQVAPSAPLLQETR